MRIMIITDSLGCPREEMGVDNTWTDMLLKKYSLRGGVWFYTYCKHGLITTDIDINYIKEISPDIIIIQSGVVDACRRTLSKRELRFIMRVPVIRDLIQIICSKFHYEITKFRNIHRSSVDEFCDTISQIKTETGAKVIFIAIAPAGDFLIKKTYKVENDIAEYNDAVSNVSGMVYLNPYIGEEDFLLSDGHHLNLHGEEIVFSAVDKVIDCLLGSTTKKS